MKTTITSIRTKANEHLIMIALSSFMLSYALVKHFLIGKEASYGIMIVSTIIFARSMSAYYIAKFKK